MEQHEKIRALEDVYQNHNISRAVLVYADEESFQDARRMLKQLDFPIMTCDSDEHARIYPLRVGEDPFYTNILWDQVNMVISWEPDADAYASFLVNTEGQENILLIHI